MDATDNHYRRYTKRLIIEKIEKPGFNIIKAKYINTLGFFGWWFNGKIMRRRLIPFRQTLIFDKIVPLLGFVENFLNPPFGQSLVLIAKK